MASSRCWLWHHSPSEQKYHYAVEPAGSTTTTTTSTVYSVRKNNGLAKDENPLCFGSYIYISPCQNTVSIYVVVFLMWDFLYRWFWCGWYWLVGWLACIEYSIMRLRLGKEWLNWRCCRIQQNTIMNIVTTLSDQIGRCWTRATLVNRLGLDWTRFSRGTSPLTRPIRFTIQVKDFRNYLCPSLQCYCVDLDKKFSCYLSQNSDNKFTVRYADNIKIES